MRILPRSRVIVPSLVIALLAGRALGQDLQVTTSQTTSGGSYNDLFITGGGGALVQNTGTLNANIMRIGQEGAEPSFTLNGGTANITKLVVSPYLYSRVATFSGALFVNGGTLNVTDLWLSDGQSNYLNSRVVQTGGTVDSNNVRIASGIGNNAAYYLNGGTLATTAIWGSGSNSNVSRLLSLNGGTLRAKDNNDNFIGSNISAIVGPNGFTLDTNGFNIGLHGGFADDGAVTNIGSIIKDGAGTLTLYGGSSHRGGYTLKGGTLSVSADGNLGATGAPIYFIGGTLRVTGTTLTNLDARTTNGATFSGGFDIADAANTFTFSQSLSGSGSLTKSGAGTLVLSSASTRSGTTTVAAGTLRVGDALALQNSLLDLTGGTFDIGAFTAVTLGGLGGTTNFALQNNASAALTLTLNGGGNGVYSGNLSGAGSIIKTGAGTQTLAGTNTHTGGTTVSAGALRFAKTSALPSTGTFTVASGATGIFNVGGSGEFTISDVINQTPAFQSGSTLGLDTTNASGGDFIFSNALIGSVNLNKLGTNVLTLTGTNTYTGTTTVSAGTLQIGAGGTTGSIASTSIVNNSALTFNRSDATAYTGVISGTGVVNKLGAGVLTLSGTNTYTGGTTIGAGLVEWNAAANFGTGNITLNGGGIRWASGSSTDISNRLAAIQSGGGTFDTNGNNVTLGTAISGTGGITKTGAGTLILTAANTWTGGTVVNSGTLQLGGSPTAGIGIIRGALTINSGATLLSTASNTFGYETNVKINTVTINGGLLDHTGAADQGWGVAYTLNGGTMRTNNGVSSSTTSSKFAFGNGSSVTVGANTGTSTIAGRIDFRTDLGQTSVDFNVGANSTLELTAAITSNNGITPAPGALLKSGTGTLVLSGANIYSGGTTVTGGLLEIGALTNLGSGNLTLNGGGMRWATGTSFNILPRLNALGADGGTFDTNGNNVNFSSAVSGTGGLTKAGAGTLTLSVANTYAGGTTVNAGTLTAGHTGSFGNGTVRINGGTLNLGNLAVANALDVRGGSLTGAASYTGTQTLTGAANYSGTVSGSVIVSNGGTLTTTGATFTGATTVQAGGTVSGTGTFNGLATFAANSHLAAGNSPGTITFNGGLNLNTGAILDFELGTTSDKILVTGGTLTGPSSGKITVNLTDSGGFTAGNYTFIDATGATLASIGATSFELGTTIAGYTYTFSQTGNQFVLTASAIPEPSTFAALAGLGILTFAVTRRVRKG